MTDETVFMSRLNENWMRQETCRIGKLLQNNGFVAGKHFNSRIPLPQVPL